MGEQAPVMQRLLKALLAARQRELLRSVAELVQKFQGVAEDSAEAMTSARDELRDIIMAARRMDCPDTDVLLKAEKLRKVLHNKIQDMKGQIRIICRARPLSKKEAAQGDGLVV